MGRIDRLHLHAFALQPASGKPRIRPPFDTMAMQHVDPKLGAEARNLADDTPVAQTGMAGHGNTGQPEHAIVVQAAECGRIAVAAGIADNAHFGPKLGLTKRQIVDMPEETPRGRAQTMHNSKRRAHWTLHSNVQTGAG